MSISIPARIEPRLSLQSWPLYQPAHWTGVLAGAITLVGIIGSTKWRRLLSNKTYIKAKAWL